MHQPSKDFKELNKLGAISGCTNAKVPINLSQDISKYRGNSDVRVKVKEGQKYFDIKLPPEDFVFGIPNRPSTPIKNVICNTYAKDAEEAQKEREAVLKVLNEDTKSPTSPDKDKKPLKVNVNRKEEI